MRIHHLETLTTSNHPSSLVHAQKNQQIKSVFVAFLQAGILRRRTLAAQHTQISSEKIRELTKDVEEMEKLLAAWMNGDSPACDEWNVTTTWIIARKTVNDC